MGYLLVLFIGRGQASKPRPFREEVGRSHLSLSEARKGGENMEVEAAGSPGFARGEREGKNNSNMAVTLDYGLNISVVVDLGGRTGRKNKGEKKDNPRGAEDRWERGGEVTGTCEAAPGVAPAVDGFFRRRSSVGASQS